ncbi:hypothetical protein LOTGIDRAFT_238767 [Lottia gigantea]|uniref:Uncharacterized protein n=1 Tax=Lottia gigantea TaxID=225164 RepID=V4AQT2_LOTGI|nr:hypothetical protein LOTGIDRAFT_238767 [Lottia gigantea]ESO99602.1 hypothetical protein LOTGIDRAFT_238767 [Lottia gigantea]
MMSMPKQRLDFRHGFMKQIVKNQIDRDNYDKEVKMAKECEKSKTKRERHGGQSNRKPEIMTYVPPSKQGKDPKNELFILEFEDQDGEIHSAMVYKNDNPEEVAKKIGYDSNLTPPYITALSERITEEINKRL